MNAEEYPELDTIVYNLLDLGFNQEGHTYSLQINDNLFIAYELGGEFYLCTDRSYSTLLVETPEELLEFLQFIE